MSLDEVNTSESQGGKKAIFLEQKINSLKIISILSIITEARALPADW